MTVPPADEAKPPHASEVRTALTRESSGPIQLLQEAAPVPGEIEEKEARSRILGRNVDTLGRGLLIIVMAVIFIWLNRSVMNFVTVAYDMDIKQMTKTPVILKPTERLVTTEVILSMIGATVVQVGVAFVAIVSYLFPKSKDNVAESSK